MKKIDINCDLGEGFGNEAEIMPYIRSCNIACGGHVGDEISIEHTVKLAIKHNVKIGAHPSYPDSDNFGRKSITINKMDLQESLKDQLLRIVNITESLGVKLHHIKPHGALYNDVASNEELASWCLEVFKEFNTKLYAPYNSVIARIANKYGVEVVFEAFADRNYNSDLSLVSRKKPNAVLINVVQIIEHLKCMFYKGYVKSIEGNEIKINADTFCVHSDTPNAVTIIKRINEELRNIS